MYSPKNVDQTYFLIIVGFPTETEEMFDNSLNLISEAGLQLLHVFPFSARNNTPAAKMPQVPHVIRKERAKRLREEGLSELNKFLKLQSGKKVKVIVEQEGLGRSDNFLQVKLPSHYQFGEIVDVTISNHEDKFLIAG